MENFNDWVGIFTQAPLAVILLIFMYLVLKQQTLLINKLIELLETQARIIKQQERKE